jgi:hypothetical protein
LRKKNIGWSKFKGQLPCKLDCLNNIFFKITSN